MYILGVFYYGGMNHVWGEIRWLGVLQRLALCYLFAGLLYCHLKVRGMIAVCAALLIGYWILLAFVPVPGATAVSWEKGENWATYIDAHFLPGTKHEGTWDAEGLLSTIPAVSSCLLGVFAAMLLANKTLTDQKKVLYFVGIGAALAAVGGVWGLGFPIIKMIWTSSYALLAGGLSFIALGVLYLLVDVWKLRAWAKPFIWIGANPLTIYLARNMFDFNKLADRFVGGSIQATLGPDWGYLARMIVSLGLSLLVVRFLYVKKIFLRV
jgi:predicted acyltransferase